MKTIFKLMTLSLLIFSCESPIEPDLPPIVSILSPSSDQLVSGSVLITVSTDDDEGVTKVEFYIDDSLYFTDIESPYEYDWNTSDYTDGEVTIYVISYDMSGNTSVTQPIVLNLNNLDSYPTSSDIYPIIFENNSFNITWSINDDNDFQSYILYESTSDDMSDQIELFTSTSAADTSFIVGNIEQSLYQYYQIEVNDSMGFSTKSNIVRGNSWLRFVKTFDYGQSISLSSVKKSEQTIDGGYILIDKELNLIKLDMFGNIDWVISLNDGETIISTSVIETNDNGFLVYFTEDGENGAHNIGLIKTDLNGNVEWRQDLSDDDDDQFFGTSVQQTSDNGYILTGGKNIYDMGQTQDYILLVKVNSNGQLEWEKMFMEGDNYGRGNSVQEISDGYMILGKYGTQSILIRTGLDGSSIWNRNISGGEGHLVQQTSNGDFITINTDWSYSDTYLIKVSDSGYNQWVKTYSDNVCGSFQQTLDNGYMIVCNNAILKTDNVGNIQSESNDILGHSNSIESTTDGGFFISGYTTSDFDFNARVYKTDLNGFILPESDWE